MEARPGQKQGSHEHTVSFYHVYTTVVQDGVKPRGHLPTGGAHQSDEAKAKRPDGAGQERGRVLALSAVVEV